MQNKAKEKKGILKGGNLNPFLVLMTMVVICTIVSYFVVPGAFDRETVTASAASWQAATTAWSAHR